MQYRKFETNIPSKGTARPQSQLFIHVSVSNLYTTTIGLSILLQVDRSWEYIDRLQTHEGEIGTEAAQFLF